MILPHRWSESPPCSLFTHTVAVLKEYSWCVARFCTCTCPIGVSGDTPTDRYMVDRSSVFMSHDRHGHVAMASVLGSSSLRCERG